MTIEACPASSLVESAPTKVRTHFESVARVCLTEHHVKQMTLKRITLREGIRRRKRTSPT
jgi:hypothetical protein